MRAKMAWLCLVVAGVLTLGGCTGAASEVRVSEEDDGGEVTLGVGQVLVVELPGNPTTGFTWNIAEQPASLASLGEPEFSAESDLIGAGGMITLRFTAEEAGSGRLELQYARPWESVQPEDTYSIDVTVR